MEKRIPHHSSWTAGLLLAWGLVLSACHHHHDDTATPTPSTRTKELLVGAGMRGGPGNAGTLFSVDPASRELNLASTFNGTPYHSYTPSGAGGFVYNPGDGPVYALANAGGGAECGAIVSFPPGQPGLLTTLYSFTAALEGKHPIGTPAMMAGALYGITEAGGANNLGTIWKFTLATRNLQVLAHLGTSAAAGSPPTLAAQGFTTGLISDGSGLYAGFGLSNAWVRIRPALGDAIDLPVGERMESITPGFTNQGYGLQHNGADYDLYRVQLQPDQDMICNAGEYIPTSHPFGSPPLSVIYSESGNQSLYLTGSSPLSPGFAGALVRINTSTNLTQVYQFPNTSPLRYPRLMQALPLSRLLGWSEGSSQAALWEADTITYQPRLLLQLAGDETFGSTIGVGPRQGFVWTAPIVSSPNPSTLIAYAVDNSAITRTSLGYGEAASPVGAPVRQTDDNLYGLCLSNDRDAEGFFDGFSGGNRFYRWDPQSGQRTLLGSSQGVIRLTHPPVCSPDASDTHLYTVGVLHRLSPLQCEWKLVQTAVPSGARTSVDLGDIVADASVSARSRGAVVAAVGASPLTVYACSQTLVAAVPVGGASATTIGVLPGGSVTVGAPVISGTTLIVCFAAAGNGGVARFNLGGALPVIPAITDLPGGTYFDSTPFVAADGTIVASAAYEALGGGALYRIDPASGTLNSLVTINGGAATACPRGTLCQSADGTIWGMATTTSGNGRLANDSATGSYVWGYRTNGTMVYQALSRPYGFGDTFPGLINAAVNEDTLSVPSPDGNG